MPDSPIADAAPWLACIAGELRRVDVWLEEQFQPERPRLAPLLEHLRCLRGKRLRAAQVLLVGQACGGVREEHVAVAGIVEMIHAATLVHDDLLDAAQRRRGVHCVHVEWGDHNSVLLGDWVYARAFQRSTELRDPACSRVLAAATRRVCAGEIEQNLSRGDFALSEDEYLQQIDGKTAALYEAGGWLGAHYAGAAPELIAACAGHGLLAGRAFQIVDDLLDLEGDEELAGKSLGTDWARGKMTLPLIRLRERLDGPRRRRLEQAFQSGVDRTFLHDGRFAGELQAALAACRAAVEKLLEEAQGCLNLLADGSASAALRALTRYVAERQK